jgi:hypothetical protein
MGSGTSFDPDILQDAADDLARIDTIIKDSTSLSNMSKASSIQEDVSSMDDTKGGWQYVSDQMSGVATAVSNHVSDLKTIAGQVHQAMQASIDTLKGADTDNASTVNQSGYDGSDSGNSSSPSGVG